MVHAGDNSESPRQNARLSRQVRPSAAANYPNMTQAEIRAELDRLHGEKLLEGMTPEIAAAVSELVRLNALREDSVLDRILEEE